MRTWIWLVLVGCAHVSAIETSESAPETGLHVTSRLVRYAVRGNTVQELRDEMSRIGPIDDGRHQFAHTWGNYAWHFPYEKSGAGCATGAVRVELEIVQTYPEWISSSGASAATVGEWKRWLAATEAHEAGHRKILLSTATEIVHQLAALPPQPTCDEMDRVANERGHGLIGQMRNEHAAYDGETRHGATTGAELRKE